MSRYENMSYNDIAEALNISPKTVQYHISGALAELRKLLSAMAFFSYSLQKRKKGGPQEAGL